MAPGDAKSVGCGARQTPGLRACQLHWKRVDNAFRNSEIRELGTTASAPPMFAVEIECDQPQKVTNAVSGTRPGPITSPSLVLSSPSSFSGVSLTRGSVAA